MATYGNWLEAQSGRGDDIGLAAAAWRDAAGSRPKASAIKTITEWLVSQGVEGLADDQVEPTMVAAATEYRALKAGATAAALGVPVAGSAGPSPALMAVLERVEGKLDVIWARIEPVVALLAEPGEERQAAEQGQDGPVQVSGLLEAADEAREAADELAARQQGPDQPLSESQLRARGLAVSKGWIGPQEDPGEPVTMVGHTPEFAETLDQAGRDLAGAPEAPVVALYGRHVVPEPDWQRLADEGQPEADEAS